MAAQGNTQLPAPVQMQQLAPLTNVSTNLNNHAGKIIGYPGLCQFMASDNDFFLLRRFGDLNVRVLLDIQHDISECEKQLHDLDEKCRNDPDPNARMDSLNWDRDPRHPYAGRAKILWQLRGLLHQYNDHILTYSQLRQRETAQNYQVSSLQNWFKNYNQLEDPNSGAVKPKDYEWLKQRSDLVCIAPETKSPLTLLLEKSKLLRKMFSKQPRAGQATTPAIEYWSGKMMKGLGDSVVIIAGLLMLYGPMWWLNWVADDSKRLGIITGFVAFFALGLRILGEGRPFEVLAATAAYAAVLMVFFQKQGGDETK